MGYVPDLGAKQLVGKSSKLIGIFMPEFEFEATPEFHEFFPPLHKALPGLLPPVTSVVPAVPVPPWSYTRRILQLRRYAARTI